MAKFYGKVGYVQTVDNERGVKIASVIERRYRGDVVRNHSRISYGDKVNADVTVSNEISIVADPYAVQNVHSIRYVEYLNSKWSVASVRVEYPRVILTLGNVYDGPVGR